MEDKRVICQVCGADDTLEYRVSHLTVKDYFIVDEVMYLCKDCGPALADGIQSALPDIIGGK